MPDEVFKNESNDSISNIKDKLLSCAKLRSSLACLHSKCLVDLCSVKMHSSSVLNSQSLHLCTFCLWAIVV